jgi:hypothetical protein
LIRTTQRAKPNERIEQQKEIGKEEKVEKEESLSNKLQRHQSGNRDAGSQEKSYSNDPLMLVIPRTQSKKFSS